MCTMHLKASEFECLASEILRKGAALKFKAHGSSMFPFIRHGDILTVRPVEAVDVKVGDSVFCRFRHGKIVVHRVIKRCLQENQIKFIIRGDAHYSPDGRVQAEHVLGIVTHIQRGHKSIYLSQGLYRIAGLLWIKIYPFSALFVKATRILSRRMEAT